MKIGKQRLNRWDELSCTSPCPSPPDSLKTEAIFEAKQAFDSICHTESPVDVLLLLWSCFESLCRFE